MPWAISSNKQWEYIGIPNSDEGFDVEVSSWFRVLQSKVPEHMHQVRSRSYRTSVWHLMLIVWGYLEYISRVFSFYDVSTQVKVTAKDFYLGIMFCIQIFGSLKVFLVYMNEGSRYEIPVCCPPDWVFSDGFSSRCIFTLENGIWLILTQSNKTLMCLLWYGLYF